jgi:Domain of unknown function (DUF4389)
MTTAEATPEFAESQPYPVRLDVERPESQSRLTNFPIGVGMLIRTILLIPHLIIVYFLGILASILYFIAMFAILFTGSYPLGLYNIVAAYMRWTSNFTGYFLSLYDRYPPFSGDAQQYPLSFEAVRPEHSSRILNFPILGYLVRSVLDIPHIVILFFLGLIAIVVVFVAQFAILFKGSFPRGMHGFAAGYLRWNTRNNSYLLGLTDKYPPFSTS